MKAVLLAILLLSTARGACAREWDPVGLFSKIFVPALKGFETTKVETGLRGFWLRGDSFPGIEGKTPSAYGIRLTVTIHDEGPQARFRDERKDLDGFSSRSVTLPQKSTEDSSLEIAFLYGSEAEEGVVKAIHAQIDGLIRTANSAD